MECQRLSGVLHRDSVSEGCSPQGTRQPTLIINSIFVLLFVFWKVVKKTKMPSLAEMDLMGGKPEIDALESTWEKPIPRNVLERVSRLHTTLQKTCAGANV